VSWKQRLQHVGYLRMLQSLVPSRDYQLLSLVFLFTLLSSACHNSLTFACRFIEAEDLLRFLSREEVEYVLPLFEGAAETEKIRKSALKNWVVAFNFFS